MYKKIIALGNSSKINSLNIHNNPAVNTTLPAERFGNNVNLSKILFRVLKKYKSEIGKNPLVSVIGSMTYGLDKNGCIDWDMIDDIDLRFYSKKEIPHSIELSIMIDLYKELSQIPGLKLETPNMGDSKLESLFFQKWNIQEQRTGKKYFISVFACTENDLFFGKHYKTYLPTHHFFGNTAILDKIFSDTPDHIIANSIAKSYHELIKETKHLITDTFFMNHYMDRIKCLKHLYQCAKIIKREKDYRFLLIEYKNQKENYNKNSLENNIWEALKSLDIPITNLELIFKQNMEEKKNEKKEQWKFFRSLFMPRITR